MWAEAAGGVCRVLVARVRRALGDRRGVTAVAFGVGATMIVGMVGLGTEGGTWYLTQRDSQNAADTAAYAGAVRLAFAQSNAGLGLSLTAAQVQARDAATDTATRNGFTSGTVNGTVTVVTPSTPPASGNFAGLPNYVQATIQSTVPRLISGLFLTANPVITTTGVAGILSAGPACLLAGSGGLSMGGNTTVSAPSCVLASNATGSSAIDIFGNASVTAASLTTTGGCSGCASATLQTGYTEYGLPTTNPFAALDALTLPTATTPPGNGGCIAVTGNPATVSPSPGKALCNFKVNGGATVHFTPGAYYVYNSDFTVLSGTVDCPTCAAGGAGVTFVFIGSAASQIGGPDISANATVNLTAPSVGYGKDPGTGATNSAWDGILFYSRTTASGSNRAQITGGSGDVLTGAMYFPNATFTYNGNPNTSQCSIIVAQGISLNGNPGVNATNCATLLGGTGVVPATQVVRLVQ